MEDDAIVHVIDDDPSMRRSVESLLRSVDIVARTYESARAFLASEQPDLPGCLLLDVRLPGLSGLDFQSQLERLGIGLPVIMMTAHGDIPMTVQAMKAGATDFLPKPFRDQDLIDAVAVAIERDRVRRIDDQELALVRERYALLSDREKQVMAFVTNGRLNKQVAFDLGLSEITIKIHRASGMRKMGARTLPDLVKMAQLLKL
ncbi:Nodulation protein W [Sphingomonas hengshuiensis]|uniref:Nodulation protein W n=2 Tax=Sphingomonas hengshuiensis TaxID=1609977 RepID=A0A7U4J6H9_9SPHN|nr:Nodulation protein W [Sphingomonas hengshuiensis]